MLHISSVYHSVRNMNLAFSSTCLYIQYVGGWRLINYSHMERSVNTDPGNIHNIFHELESNNYLTN